MSLFIGGPLHGVERHVPTGLNVFRVALQAGPVFVTTSRNAKPTTDEYTYERLIHMSIPREVFIAKELIDAP